MGKMTVLQTTARRTRLESLHQRLDAALRDLREIREQITSFERRDSLADLCTTLRRRSRHLRLEHCGEESLH